MPSSASSPLLSPSRRRTLETRVVVLGACVSLAFHAALLLGIHFQFDARQPLPGGPAPTQVLRAVAINSEAGSILPAPSPATTNDATPVDRMAHELKPSEERQQSIPGADEGERQSTASANVTTPPVGGSDAPFWRGFRDSRLSIAPRAPEPGYQPAAHSALDARVRAVQDSLTADRRSLPNTLARGYYPGGGTIKIMPEDGRIWELSELLRQNQAFVRDSIRRERVRVTRERKDAERTGRRQP